MPDDSRSTEPESAATAELLARARTGDREALDRLFAEELPRLRRWASGRLPRWARDAVDTSDVLQETLLETFKRLDNFEPRGVGALQAYLRQAVVNRVRNQLRRIVKRPLRADLEAGWPDGAPSPLEQTIGRETLDRYEAALEQLEPGERDAVVSRIEFGMTYAEIADALDKPSPDAARMAVVRALERLVAAMARQRVGGQSQTAEAPPKNVRFSS